jgi:hypothetical protein
VHIRLAGMHVLAEGPQKHTWPVEQSEFLPQLVAVENCTVTSVVCG